MSERDADFVQLAGVVRETFHLDPGFEIRRSTTSADIDGWDSLSHSILIMGVEESFGIELPVDQIYDLPDVGALLDLIRATRGIA